MLVSKNKDRRQLTCKHYYIYMLIIEWPTSWDSKENIDRKFTIHSSSGFEAGFSSNSAGEKSVHTREHPGLSSDAKKWDSYPLRLILHHYNQFLRSSFSVTITRSLFLSVSLMCTQTGIKLLVYKNKLEKSHKKNIIFSFNHYLRTSHEFEFTEYCDDFSLSFGFLNASSNSNSYMVEE
jgi:hypothetical protein